MLAEAIMEHNEIKIIKFPKNKFKGNHWILNIESIEEIKGIEESQNDIQFKYKKKDPTKHLRKIEYKDDVDNLNDIKLYTHIDNTAKYIHDLRRARI